MLVDFTPAAISPQGQKLFYFFSSASFLVHSNSSLKSLIWMDE